MRVLNCNDLQQCSSYLLNSPKIALIAGVLSVSTFTLSLLFLLSSTGHLNLASIGQHSISESVGLTALSGTTLLLNLGWLIHAVKHERGKNHPKHETPIPPKKKYMLPPMEISSQELASVEENEMDALPACDYSPASQELRQNAESAAREVMKLYEKGQKIFLDFVLLEQELKEGTQDIDNLFKADADRHLYFCGMKQLDILQMDTIPKPHRYFLTQNLIHIIRTIIIKKGLELINQRGYSLNIFPHDLQIHMNGEFNEFKPDGAFFIRHDPVGVHMEQLLLQMTLALKSMDFAPGCEKDALTLASMSVECVIDFKNRKAYIQHSPLAKSAGLNQSIETLSKRLNASELRKQFQNG